MTGYSQQERWFILEFSQFSSDSQSFPNLCDPMDSRTPVHQLLLEVTQTHVHRVGDGIQPFHPLSSPSPPTFKRSEHQSLFQLVSSSHQVAKGLEYQLQSNQELILQTDSLFRQSTQFTLNARHWSKQDMSVIACRGWECEGRKNCQGAQGNFQGLWILSST